MKKPCGRCQGMMNEFMDLYGVEIEYTWNGGVNKWP
ncbi:hypothetical protein [Streptomyces sp. NPDC101237]